MRKTLLAGIAVAALTLSGCATTAEEVEEVAVEETETTEETTMEEEPAVEEGPGTIVEVAVAWELSKPSWPQFRLPNSSTP